MHEIALLSRCSTALHGLGGGGKCCLVCKNQNSKDAAKRGGSQVARDRRIARERIKPQQHANARQIFEAVTMAGADSSVKRSFNFGP